MPAPVPTFASAVIPSEINIGNINAKTSISANISFKHFFVISPTP
jgi:hypothetical protein